MTHKLSIIMPCYNSTATLEEAVLSIYTQELEIPYEVVLVDDGSTDGTRELIAKLAQAYPHIRYVFHEENRGGGAARNTAIEHTTGNLIFCLDSDNILGPGILPKMVACLDEKKCDGVAIHDRRFFRDKTSAFKSSIQTPIHRNITLEDRLLAGIELDNFLYTKEAFNATEGYPSEHGFDTQSYQVRFLSKGMRIFICPNTYYYHRQGQPKKKSYFEEVYESGEYSRNLYLILEDIMYLFSIKSRKEILDYDIWANSRIDGDNLMTHLRGFWARNEKKIFVDDHLNYLKIDGWDEFFSKHQTNSHPLNMYCCAIYCYKRQRYNDALEYYRQILLSGVNSKIVYMNILRILIGISGETEKNDIDKSFQDLINSMSLRRQQSIFRRSLFDKIFVRVKRMLTQ